MRKKLLGLLRLAPIALLLVAGVAHAQTTGTLVGTVTDAATGKPVAGALVIATSPALQGEQTAITDGGGNYTITVLPPGRYKVAVQLQGYKPAERSDIVLRVDFTLRVPVAIIPEAVQMEEQVVKTGMAPVINIGSAEPGQVLSREFLSTVPTTRTFGDTAFIAPTAQRDYYGISFAGATSPESTYVIDGLRVSSPDLGTLGTNLLTNFLEQLDVKVGSFMPEYGYSQGGILNAVTKSGSNEFHGSLWGNITPGFFTPRSPSVARAGEAIGTYASPYKGSYDADFGLEVGGPIAKDKLWFYAGVAPQLTYNARTYFNQYRLPATTAGAGCVNSSSGATAACKDQYGNYVMEPISGSESVYGSGFSRYFFIGKLTWLLNENNTITVSGNSQPTSNYGFARGNAALSFAPVSSDANSTNAIANYSGKFIDKHLLVNASFGWFNSSLSPKDATTNGVSLFNDPAIIWQTRQPYANLQPGFVCPVASTQTGNTNNIGCYVQNYITGGGDYFEDNKSNRYAGAVSLTGLFNAAGQHQLKGGVQIEYATYEATKWYSGGFRWQVNGLALDPWLPAAPTGSSNNRIRNVRGYGVVTDPVTRPNGDVAYTNFVTGPGNVGGLDSANYGTSQFNTNTWTNGYYLQDSWTIANQLTLNFGVRLDTQQMKNATPGNDPTAPTPSLTEWQPRVQAIWDFTGNGRGKIQGNWGRYYASFPLDMAARAFGTENQVQGAYRFTDCRQTDTSGKSLKNGGNPAAACPNVYGLNVGEGPGVDAAGAHTGNTTTLAPNSYVAAGGFFPYSGSYTPVDPNLVGPYTDQFGGGIQYEILQDLALGVEYIGTRLGSTIEDMSSNDFLTAFIANPATSSPWTITSGPYAGAINNPQQAATIDQATQVYYMLNWPAAKRQYDALTFTVNKTFSKRWLATASYTYSMLQGNYSGFVRDATGQLDPGISSDYDLAGLMGNKNGPLGGNRSHQIKAAGSYMLELSPTTNLTLGTTFWVQSGWPTTALGAHEAYGPSESFILPRGMAGDLPWLWNLDLNAKATIALSGPYALNFTIDIFNVFNNQGVQWVDQNWTFDATYVVPNGQCANKNAITQKNPREAILADCPDLAYVRTPDGRAITPNLNFGQPTTGPRGLAAFQIPLRVRLGASLTF